jgi:L-asparagine oxygenase
MSMLETPISSPTVVWTTSDAFDLTAVPERREDLVRAAGHASGPLPRALHDALVDFADEVPRSGALLAKGLPLGHIPPTPADPTDSVDKDLTSEFVLLSVARRLGQPVGYAPEHGGDLVQNISPVPTAVTSQTSTSSAVTLMFHTEAAFHPHRPRYLLLLCLRGDPSAATLLCSVHDVLPHLDAATRRVLFEPRFRTAADESYTDGASGWMSDPMPVLSGDPERPTLVFDAELMVGTDTAAERALVRLRTEVEARAGAVVLESGDLLVVDNNTAVHGRSKFAARFDGTDRWLQRTFVVADLAPSAAERDGRIITTTFA